MSTSAAQQGRNQNGEYNILDSIIAETRLSPDDEAYDIAKRGVSAFIEELLAAERRRAGEEGDGRPDDRRDRCQAQHADGRDPPSSRFPGAGVGLARPATAGRPHQLPREHQDRDSQRFQAGPAGRFRGLARGDAVRPVQAHLHRRIRPVRWPAGRRHHRQLLHVAQFARRQADAIRLQRGLHGPCAVRGGRRSEVLRPGKLHRPAGPEGPEGSFRRPAVRQVAELPPVRGFPLRGADRTALLRTPYDPEENPVKSFAYGDRGQQPRALPVGQHRLCPSAPS